MYYKACCGKYSVSCSIIGDTESCSPGMGGPTSDHPCMEVTGLFEENKCANPSASVSTPVPEHLNTVQEFPSKKGGRGRGCALRTSGIVRKSNNNLLSFAQRDTNFSLSSLRNFGL